MSRLLPIALAVAAAAQGAGPFRFREAGPKSLELTENGKPVFVYNHGKMLAGGAPERYRRSGYLHPVHAPDGTVVTDDFPKDHYHHHGIFWAWPIVRVGGEQFDLWIGKGVEQRFERWLERRAGPDSATLGVENAWYAGERKLVRETARVTARPVRDGARVLEFHLRFEAPGAPVTLSGAPERKKGYGGFSVRLAPREQMVIRTDAGQQSGDSDMTRHAWAEVDAVYQGRRAVFRLEDDPGNPGAPNGWCLRLYGLETVNFPGLDTHTLDPGRPLDLRYKVVIRSLR
jgi:hypothetical protein